MAGRTFKSHLDRRISYVLAVKDNPGDLPGLAARCASLKGPDDELVVVDGSAPEHREAMLAALEGWADVVVSEPDRSGAHALNKGILLSRGRYVRLLTIDDTIHREGTEQAVAVLDSHPGVGVMLCGGTREKDGVLSHFYVPSGVDYGAHPGNVLTFGGCGVGMFVRKEAFALAGLLSQVRMLTDPEFVMRAIFLGVDVRFCRCNVFHHPIDRNSTTVRLAAEKPAVVRWLRETYVQPFPVPIPGWPKPDPTRCKPVWDGGFS